MDAGGKAKDSVIAVFLPAFVWMAIGLLLSASAFLVHNRMLLGGGMLGLAFGFAIITGVLFRRYKENSDAAYMVCTVKILGVILDLLALYLVFQSLHYVASLHQITALAASGPLGAAVAIVPAGLGVREVASAGLGNIVGLSAAVSFLVPSLYRLVTMAVLAAVAVCFTYGSRKDDE
ncbi:MAG: flippase-like domain-containing protein [Kordiimonadaceae bacterium]|nr:flippase-like domain-containing protein [Kordiimonadaceae bacterium]